MASRERVCLRKVQTPTHRTLAGTIEPRRTLTTSMVKGGRLGWCWRVVFEQSVVDHWAGTILSLACRWVSNLRTDGSIRPLGPTHEKNPLPVSRQSAALGKAGFPLKMRVVTINLCQTDSSETASHLRDLALVESPDIERLKFGRANHPPDSDRRDETSRYFARASCARDSAWLRYKSKPILGST